MAYNPFNIFRRNQKALFAVLTVFIMIMFTLQSGVAGGDFFETVMRWFGANKGSKEPVCKIDGHTVTAAELEGPRGVQFKRVMANRFMYHAARETTGALMDYASQQRERLSPQGKLMADAARRALGFLEQLNRNPQFRQLLNSPGLESFAEEQFRSLTVGQQAVDETIQSPDARSEDKDVARVYRVLFILSKYLQDGQGEHYFINAPNKTRRDLVEFKLWEKKADQLGIRFSKDDVKKLIQNDFYNSFKSDVNVRKILQQTPGFTMDVCLEALAIEFKVRAAQTAVLGVAGRDYGAPFLSTPYELFEYYRDQTSASNYEVIAVPASAFVDKVTEEPTDAEITDLFKKYANEEPNPKNETPGFKEPRKIAIAWLGITGEEPYYKNLATEQIKVGEVMAKASGMLTVPLPGATGLWAAAAAAPLSLKEPAVDAAYTDYTFSFRMEMERKYSSANIPTRDLLPTSMVRLGSVAAAVGGFAGNPMAGVVNAMSAPIAYEIRDRVKVGIPLVLGGPTGPAFMPGLIGAAAASRGNEPKPLPIEAMRPELIKIAIDKRAKVIAFGARPAFPDIPNMPQMKADKGEKGDVDTFIEELKKLSENGRPKDKAATDKYIKDFITARGLAYAGASTAPRDEWTLEEDPGLRPLLEAHKTSVLQAKFTGAHGGGGPEPYLPFGRSFFWTRDPATGRPTATTGTYLGDTYPPQDRQVAFAEGRPHFVVWRTEDIAAKPTNQITARAAVVTAWKRTKARERALAHANALAEQIRNSPNTDLSFITRLLYDLQVTIKDPKVPYRQPFPISGVAPFVPGPPSRFGGRSGLQPFGLRESEEIPYPTLEMVNSLIDNRDKPLIKTVVVMPDGPKDTYYVAVLTNRTLKTPMEFKLDVYSRIGSAGVVRNRFQEESINKTRRSVVELLKKEFKYEETEDQKKKLDENAKSGNRNLD